MCNIIPVSVYTFSQLWFTNSIIISFILIHHVPCVYADFWTYVEKSFTWTDLPSKFPTKFVQHPVSNNLFLVHIIELCIIPNSSDTYFQVYSASVHVNYVDCTRWLGDFILSKVSDCSVSDYSSWWNLNVMFVVEIVSASRILCKTVVSDTILLKQQIKFWKFLW